MKGEQYQVAWKHPDESVVNHYDVMATDAPSAMRKVRQMVAEAGPGSTPVILEVYKI